MSDDTRLVPHPGAAPAVLEDLQRFEGVLLATVDRAGLPTEGVLVRVNERGRVFDNLNAALERLDGEQRARSFYISKMLAAVASGLFDAALNYLWDETVAELRRRVAGYDLAYFFDLAVRSPDRRRGLATEEDLRKVDDADLMRAAREMGLTSEVGYMQLDHIRDMRNFASAAHPNQVVLTGLQLAGWLETCIREVITLPVDTVVAEIRKLLRNVKSVRLSAEELAAAAAFFDRLADEQADNLATGLFGIYTDTTSNAATLDNIRGLWPALWPYIGDDARYALGTKYGRFSANADQAQAELARQLLDLVNAAAYFPEPVRAAELDAVLDDLLAAHHGGNNFYTEPPLARQLESLVSERGEIPTGMATKFVVSLVEVFLTNGYGVAWGADPLYESLLGRLDPQSASTALRSFTNPTIAARLQSPLPRQQWEKLLSLLEPKLTGRSDRELFEAVRAFSGSPDQLRTDSRIQRLVEPGQVGEDFRGPRREQARVPRPRPLRADRGRG